MNEVLLTNILDVIKKSNDKNVILKGLVKIRTDVVKDREGIILFRDIGGIPPLVRLLTKPNEKIIEVALSILGNCCTDYNCCNKAIESKIVSPLLTILKSIPNPIIQCRSCRLLGNLAKEHQSYLISHSPTISNSLYMILEETSDMQTILMAVRAIKFLLSNKFFVKAFIRAYGFHIILKILTSIIKKPFNLTNDPDNTDTTKTESNSSNSLTSDECNKVNDIKPILGLKSFEHREKYFEEVARNLEGIRSDIFDLQILKKNSKEIKLFANKEFHLPEDKIKNDIISEILKSILIISESPIITSLKNSVGLYDKHGIGKLSCIVFFMEENSANYRSISLKIISNFANNPIAIPALCSADSISAACELLTNENLNPSLSETEIRNCINIICMLAGDACNRAKIRMSGALKKLIERAKISNSCIEITMILFALNHFQYDQMSMDLLLREGLVGILVKELDAYLNATDNTDKYRKEKCDEKQRMSRKRKAEEISKTSKTPKIWSEIFDLDSPNSSPTRTTSSPSPCSSRGMSPVNKHYFDEDYDSDTYSPICSEDEGDSLESSKKPSTNKQDTDIMKLLESITKSEGETLSDREDDSDENQESKEGNNYKFPSSVNNYPTTAIDVIDNLFLRISLHMNNRGELGKPETLKTIIQAMSVFGLTGNNFGSTLQNILLESKFFVQILKQDTIHRIYQLSKLDEFKSDGTNFLESLTFVGESGYGKGELTRLLSKSDNNTQKRAAVAVAFIIRTPKLLYQHLIENGALYTLINTILNKNDECSLEAADGLTSLSLSLGIEMPKCDDNFEFNENNEFDEAINFPIIESPPSSLSTSASSSSLLIVKKLKNSQKQSILHKNKNVTIDEADDEMKFILHRGCSKIPIKFQKHLLTKCSEVFNSMLNSDFKEFNEGEIHLKNYSVNGIKYFLNLIKLHINDEELNIPPIYYFDSLLEAYELSRMYMIKELEEKLFNMIIHRMSTKTCLKIFEWSLNNFDQKLSKIIINYYLSSDISSQEKVALFQEADYSKFSKEWNQMVTDAILVECQNLCIEN